MSAAAAKEPEVVVIERYPPHRPNVKQAMSTQEGKNDWFAWMQTLEEAMTRLEQWEARNNGRVRKFDWDKAGDHMAKLQHMRRQIAGWAQKTMPKTEGDVKV